ncbi:MAG: hypothetical protein ACRD2U_16385 [Terriglobales bacterium]
MSPTQRFSSIRFNPNDLLIGENLAYVLIGPGELQMEKAVAGKQSLSIGNSVSSSI